MRSVNLIADIKAVNTILTALVAVKTSEQAVQTALDSVLDAFGWTYGSYWKIDEQNQLLRFSVEAGEIGEHFRQITLSSSFERGVGLSGRAWATCDLVFARDLGEVTDCVRAPVARTGGVRSGVCFPIFVDDRIEGTMDFFSTDERSMSCERLETLRTVGVIVSQAMARIRDADAIAIARQQLMDKERGLRFQLEKQYRELKELDQVKDDFVAGVSHEFRTPLTSIVGQLELMSDDESIRANEFARHSLNVIERNAARLRHLVENLLLVAKFETRSARIEFENIDLGSVVRDACTRARHHAIEYGLELDISVDSELRVMGHAARLGDAIDHLLGNALKFTPTGGSIYVRGEIQERDSVQFAAISIEDSGYGIPEADLSRVFERFFRSQLANKLAIQGTGVGLVIAKAIADAHGAKIEIASEVGIGTCVTFLVPLASSSIKVNERVLHSVGSAN